MWWVFCWVIFMLYSREWDMLKSTVGSGLFLFWTFLWVNYQHDKPPVCCSYENWILIAHSISLYGPIASTNMQASKLQIDTTPIVQGEGVIMCLCQGARTIPKSWLKYCRHIQFSTSIKIVPTLLITVQLFMVHENFTIWNVVLPFFWSWTKKVFLLRLGDKKWP